MRNLQIFLIALFSSLMILPAAAQNARENAAMAPLLSAMEDYQARDAEAFGANFTEDADFIGPDGRYIQGRAQIIQGHRYHFSQIPPSHPEDQHTISRHRLRFLAPDVALITVTYDSSIRGEDSRLEFTSVNVRQGNAWKIQGVQLTPSLQTGAASSNR